MEVATTGPDARDLTYASTICIGREDPFQLIAKLLDLMLYGLPLIPKRVLIGLRIIGVMSASAFSRMSAMAS